MAHVHIYAVPPAKQVSALPDLTSTYREVITAGLAPAGSVRPSRFWRLPTLGDPNVFTGTRVPTPRLRASVALLWDFSGSQRTWIDSLVLSLDMIGAALTRLDLAVWAGTYTTWIGGAITIHQVHTWTDATWDHRRVQPLRALVSAMGGTPTGEVLQYVRTRLMPRAPFSRRLVVVCTDGWPANPDLVSLEVARLRAQGIVVVALYVGDRDGRTLLADQFGDRYSFAAPEHDQIPQVFTGILSRLRG